MLPLPDFAHKHEVEFAALRRIERGARSDPTSPLAPPVRAYATIDDPAALVLEDVAEPTLHRVLRDAHMRLRIGAGVSALRAVGRWLAAYHRLPGDIDVAIGSCLTEAEEVREIARRFAQHLGGSAHRLAARIEDHATAVAGSGVTVVHGDLAPGNVFINSGGRVRVIDPAPWRAPGRLDLAYLATALRTSRLALVVPGGRRIVALLVEALHDGYGEDFRDDGLAGLCDLTLLDKWSALVARAHGSSRPGAVVDRLALARVVAFAEETLGR